jgi:hypothetical protein
MRSASLTLVSTVAVLLVACEESSPTDSASFGTQVRMVPSAETFSPGSNLTIRLVNLGSRDIETGLCFTALFREEPAGDWVQAYVFADPCPSALLLIDGYRSRDFPGHIPADLPAGRYRFLKEFALLADELGIRQQELSDPFQVN